MIMSGLPYTSVRSDDEILGLFIIIHGAEELRWLSDIGVTGSPRGTGSGMKTRGLLIKSWDSGVDISVRTS